MNLYAHILKKDCRRLAIPIALWFAMLALNCYLAFSSHSAIFNHIGPITEIWIMCGTVSFWVLTVVISAGAVLEDPPKGTSAFWLTRPFARRQVAAAKFTLLGSLTLIPIAITVAMLICHGVGPGGIALTAFSSLLGTAIAPLAVAAFAVTAESFGQLAITALLILLGSGMLTGMLTAYLKLHAVIKNMGGGESINEASLGNSRLLAGQVMAIALPGLIVLWRYLNRHARYATSAVALATLVCMLTPICWPWDFIGGAKAAASAARVLQRDIPFTMRTQRSRNSAVPEQIFAWLGTEASLPEGVLVAESLSDQHLVWSSGGSTLILGHQMVPRVAADLIQPGAVAQALAPAMILNLPAKQPQQLTLPIVEEARGRLGQESATFQATVQAAVLKCEIMGEMPLEVGAKSTWGSSQFRLEGVTRHSNGSESVALREGLIDSPLAIALASEIRPAPGTSSTSVTVERPDGTVESSATTTVYEDAGPIFVLVNRARAEAIIGSTAGAISARNYGGYALRTFDLQFGNRSIDPAWLKQAVLVCLRFNRVGTATGTVTSTPFDLRP